MFDISSKRGGSRQNEHDADEELEKDRFGGAAPSAGPVKPASSGARVREAAVIGPSIHIDGDLRGEEDLIIEGNVNGTIHLSDHSLTVGSKGKIKADIYAHGIVVDGKVDGDLYGAERVSIRKNGEVRGNIVSPRVSLEDGGRFKGNIEMDQQAVDNVFGGRRTTTAAPSQASQAAKPAAGGSATAQTGRSESTGRPAGTGSGTSDGSGQDNKKGAAG